LFGNSQVDAKALAFPALKIKGMRLKPVVVKTLQGATPTGDQQKELQPAGSPDLEAGNQAGGGWFANWKMPFGGKKDEPKDDGKRFPLRLFHLVDVSSSMESETRRLRNIDGSPTRLEYVKTSIKKLLEQIPQNFKDGIEHVLIPYSERSGTVQTFSGQDEETFKDALDALGKNYGTNIFKPIESVIEYLGDLVDDQKRNLAILFSDGQHMPREIGAETDADAVAQFAQLEGANTASFNVGIGPEYNRQFMLDALKKAKFGGLAHIPSKGADANLYEVVLPEFIKDITTAPQFPVISFNKYFDRVVNISPTARQIDQTQADDTTASVIETDEHFESVAGFQNETFSVGFVEESAQDVARIFKLVKDQANSNEFDETEELTIQDFSEAALGPSERKQILEYMVLAVKNLLLESRDPQRAIQEFIDENNLPDDMARELEEIFDKLNAVWFDDDASMSMMASQSIRNHTKVDHVEIPFAADDNFGVDTQRAGGEHTRANFGAEQLGVNDQSVIEVPHEDLDRVTVSLEYMSGKELGAMELTEGQVMIIGRSDRVDINIDSSACSRAHAEISLKGGKVFIKDLGSTNGTWHNANAVSIGEVQLKPNDIVKFGQKNQFRVKFKTS